MTIKYQKKNLSSSVRVLGIVIVIAMVVAVGYFVRGWVDNRSNSVVNNITDMPVSVNPNTNNSNPVQESDSKKLTEQIIALRENEIINEFNELEDIYEGIDINSQSSFMSEGHIGEVLMQSILEKINSLKQDYPSYDFSALDNLYWLTLGEKSGH